MYKINKSTRDSRVTNNIYQKSNICPKNRAYVKKIHKNKVKHCQRGLAGKKLKTEHVPGQICTISSQVSRCVCAGGPIDVPGASLIRKQTSHQTGNDIRFSLSVIYVQLSPSYFFIDEISRPTGKLGSFARRALFAVSLLPHSECSVVIFFIRNTVNNRALLWVMANEGVVKNT